MLGRSYDESGGGGWAMVFSTIDINLAWRHGRLSLPRDILYAPRDPVTDLSYFRVGR